MNRMRLRVIIAILFYTVQASAQCTATVTCSGPCSCSTGSGTSSGTIDTGYADNWNCYWTITSSGSISLSFYRFSLETSYDYVTVTSNVQLCRQSCPGCCSGPYISTTGSLSLSLTADYSIVGSGIGASWSVSACPNAACDPGYTGSPCTACAAGTWKNTVGSAACTDCAAGKYLPTTGATLESTCVTCPANSNSPIASTALAACTCNAGMYATSPPCTDVPERLYSTEGGSQYYCTTFANDIDRSEICKPSYTMAAYFQGANEIDGEWCTLCCATCRSGMHTCPPLNQVCVTCPTGTTSPIASTSSAACISPACNAGYTGPSGGPCTACVAGKYKIASGSAACTDCAANTFSSVTGATSSGVCKSCAIGFSPAVSGAGSCTSTSSTLERSCGASGTDACTASQSSNYDVNYAAMALDGNLDSASITLNGGVQWWRLDFGRSVSVAQVIVYNRKDCCQSRLTGFKIAVGDSPSVDVNAVCASNQPAPLVSPFMAQVTCPTPLVGQYLHISISSGEYLQIGEVQVTGCPACQVVCASGTYRVASACVNCAAGKYSATAGATLESTCVACPANSNSPSPSTLVTACTCNAGSTGPDGGTCSQCVAGKYKINTGSATCTDCAAGKYLPTAGATLESTCVACPGNSNSPSASTSVAVCTCNAGSTGPDGGLTLTTDSTNLVVWYKLNGDLTDSTGRTGSLINAGGTLAFAQDTTLNSNLPYSWYAVGSGTSNLNYARSPVINRNVPLSFAFWFKTTGSGVYTILSYGDKSVENPSIQFDWNGGQLSVATALSAQWTIVPLTTGLVVNTWYFVVYTLSNANPVSTILYVDGTQRATGTGSTGQTLPRFKDLTVANSGDTGRGFAGHIGDIRIYDKVLIQAEITSLFTNMPTPCTTCAAGKYKTATGSAACTDCLANTFSSVTGATSSAVCASCATGFSPAVSGAGLCTATSSTLERSCGSSGTDACTASQSSAYDDVNFPAYKALDGNLDTITHTNSGGLQWWRLDFGRSVSVSQVIVYNRKDCCQFRLAGFKIAVGDSPSVDVNAVCASNQPAPTVSPFMAQVTCPTPLIGRYLHISVYAAAGGSDGVLSLGEVQVTGCPACQVVCAAGTYRVASACVNCATGKYSATTGATAAATCLSCPANANSLAGSTAAASCTCNPGYALLNSACACDLGYEPGA